MAMNQVVCLRKTKIEWDLAEDWTEKDIASVHLAELFLQRLCGETTLYLSTDLVRWGLSPKLTATAERLVAFLWEFTGVTRVVIEVGLEQRRDLEVPVPVHSEAQPAADGRSLSYEVSSLDELKTALLGLFGQDYNYLVHMSQYTLTEQDGDILIVHAAVENLKKLHGAVGKLAEAEGWDYVSSQDD